MTVILGLVRRAAAEAERQLRGGVGLLVRLGRDLERSAELGRLLPSLNERLAILEETVRGQDTELRTLRAELDSLVGQLNDRLLPRVDERMDDTERDLAAVATSLVRTGRDTAANQTRLEVAERRIADLRGKLAQLEQRTGLWRDLQSTMARLGDDLDAMRARMALRAAEPPADAAPAPVQNITDRPA
jgi:chromosome segregation ATPase